MGVTDWAAEVSAWRRSGLTAAEYTQERGLKLSTLRYWSCKVKRSDGGRLTRAVEIASGSRLARVGRPRSVLPAAAATGGGKLGVFRLVVGEVSVDVPKGFDAEALGRLLGVLGVAGR